jgi:hypothetical protein
MAPRIEIEGINVVAVGSFNPRLFHPDWFSKQGLISDDELKYSLDNLDTIHKTIISYPIKESHLEVSLDRLQIGGDFRANLQIRDLLVSIFSLLEHTPVTAIGINRGMHFRVDSDDQKYAILNNLSPKESYKELLKKPVLKEIQVAGTRPDSDEGYVLINVQPSVRINPGIFIEVNNHHGSSEDRKVDLQYLMEKVSRSWKDILDYAKEISEGLLQD